MILAALVTVYLVLGMLYESLIHPITILSTLSSAGVGALLALSAFKTEFSIIALIGIILLIGIVKKNAIILADFAIESRRTRVTSAAVAIREAALLRFRPILMTTMAALLGALPLAIGGGTGSELRRPLGIAMVGDLALSQLVTLFTTPVIYLWLDRIQARRKAPAAVRVEAGQVAGVTGWGLRAGDAAASADLRAAVDRRGRRAHVAEVRDRGAARVHVEWNLGARAQAKRTRAKPQGLASLERHPHGPRRSGPAASFPDVAGRERGVGNRLLPVHYRGNEWS
jgi:hypothetical protein